MEYLKNNFSLRTLLAFLLLSLFYCACQEEEQGIKPELNTLTESVYSSVTIQPEDLYNVHAAVGGIIEKIYVEEGDTVKQGQPLFQIINTTPELNTENARLALELARENYRGKAAILEEITDEMESVRLKLSNDSMNYFRQKRLWDKSIGSQNEYDTRKLNYEITQNNLKLLQSKFERTSRQLETQLQQAENNYKTTQVATKDYTVKSLINGKIYYLLKNPGELVSLQEAIASIGSASDYLIEMRIDEVDIVKIKSDQKVLITLDAYEGQVFEAIILRIYPRKDERTQTFKVEGLFKNPPDILYPGLAGEANILIAQKEEVLVIPRHYLSDDNQVKTKDGWVDVKTGLKSMDKVEIISGIDTSTQILKPQ